MCQSHPHQGTHKPDRCGCSTSDGTAKHSRRFKEVYRPIRNNIFAHRLLSNDQAAFKLFGETSRVEVAKILDFLHDLIDAIQGLYLNGNQPELGKRSYTEYNQRIRDGAQSVLRKLSAGSASVAPRRNEAAMAPVKGDRTRIEADLCSAASHVSYEIRMLIYSPRRVEGWHSSPRSVSDDEKNVALESFLLHFRNLRAFLCPSLQAPPKPDDIVATDFLREPVPRDIGNARKLASDKKRLDQMLAHLSFERDRYIEAGQDDWQAARMASDILAEFDAFLAILNPGVASLFPSRPEVAEQRARLDVLANMEPGPKFGSRYSGQK